MWAGRLIHHVIQAGCKGIQLSTRLNTSSEQYVRIGHGSTEKVVQVVAIGLAWTLFSMSEFNCFRIYSCDSTHFAFPFDGSFEQF